MLGFYLHQILEMTDDLFQKCRTVARTHSNLWFNLKALFRFFVFDTWEQMLIFFLAEEGHGPPVR
jgi:hypothetical protein